MDFFLLKKAGKNSNGDNESGSMFEHSMFEFEYLCAVFVVVCVCVDTEFDIVTRFMNGEFGSQFIIRH